MTEMQNKVIPNVTETLIAALEDIKEVISQDPSRDCWTVLFDTCENI